MKFAQVMRALAEKAYTQATQGAPAASVDSAATLAGLDWNGIAEASATQVAAAFKDEERPHKRAATGNAPVP